MNRALRTSLLGAMLAAGCIPLPAASGFQQAADNSGANKNDQTGAMTSDKAKNTTSDVALMKQIRRDLMKDKSLSTYGKNVKVIATQGKVTLRGAVHSDDEKKAIEEHATKFAGAGNVTNELSVKGS